MNIVILGATGGIGSQIANKLAPHNNLFMGGRNIDKLYSLKDKIRANTTNIVEGSILDASSFSNVESFLKEANREMGSIDTLINCIGSLILKPAHLTSEEELLETIKVNLFSSFAIIKYGIKYLRKNGGNMIFFSSAVSKTGLKNHEAIASSKGAVESLVISAASTYAKYNIRINSISPGLVATELTKSIIENDISFEYSRQLHALGRIGKPKNIIPIIECLLHEDSDWITGQNFRIDGGLPNLK